MKCEACGRDMPVGGRTRFCKDASCVRDRARDRKRKQLGLLVSMPVPVVVSIRPPTTTEGSLVESTRESLVDAGRWGTPAGDLVMVLAGRLESATSDTGSAVAAVSREFRAAFSDALAGAVLADDVVDELRVRRGRRLSG